MSIGHPLSFNINNWYWYVGGDQSQAYSSQRGVFVPFSDATFQAWLQSGGVPTNIDTTADLGAVIATEGGPRPADSNVLSGYQNQLATEAMASVLWPVVANLQNQVITQQNAIGVLQSPLSPPTPTPTLTTAATQKAAIASLF